MASVISFVRASVPYIQRTEQVCQLAGYFPTAGIAGGYTRKVLGAAQQVAAFAIVVFAAGLFVSGSSCGVPLAWMAGSFLLHGIANYCRGSAEVESGSINPRITAALLAYDIAGMFFFHHPFVGSAWGYPGV